MIREACLDANIFLAALDEREPRHRDAFGLLQTIESQDSILMEPAIVVFEVTSVLTRKSHRHEIEADEAAARVDYFSQLPLLLQWQPGLLKRSADLARRLHLRDAYDSSYLAVAEARNIPLVTLDADFLKKAKRLYDKVIDPAHFI